MIFIHDSRSEQYRNPAGALPCAGKVRLRVYAEELTDITAFACTSAGLSTTKPGGISSVPTMEAVLARL